MIFEFEPIWEFVTHLRYSLVREKLRFVNLSRYEFFRSKKTSWVLKLVDADSILQASPIRFVIFFIRF